MSKFASVVISLAIMGGFYIYVKPNIEKNRIENSRSEKIEWIKASAPDENKCSAKAKLLLSVTEQLRSKIRAGRNTADLTTILDIRRTLKVFGNSYLFTPNSLMDIKVKYHVAHQMIRANDDAEYMNKHPKLQFKNEYSERQIENNLRLSDEWMALKEEFDKLERVMRESSHIDITSNIDCLYIDRFEITK